MDYQTIAKEAAITILGEVEKLVRDDDVARRIIFAQGTDRAHADDLVDAQHFESPNVSPIIYLSWAVNMTDAVPGKKGQFFPVNCAGYHGG